MFEKFFRPESKSEEEIEELLYDFAYTEFEVGVNDISMFYAFNALRKQNKDGNYGFTNNRLLNILKECALNSAAAINDAAMGGRGEVEKNINNKIEELRQSLSDEEKRT